MPLLLIAALIVAFLAVIFALQNSAPVAVSIGVWEFEASLAIILLATLAIGFFVGLCVALPSLIRRNLRISRQKKQVAQLQSELVETRTAAASDISEPPPALPPSASTEVASGYPDESDSPPEPNTLGPY
ncbi:MAG: LapA family protein [Elainellaceae cyanobacterium]